MLPLLPVVLPRHEDSSVESFRQRVDAADLVLFVDLDMDIPICVSIESVKVQHGQVLFPDRLLGFLLLRLA